MRHATLATAAFPALVGIGLFGMTAPARAQPAPTASTGGVASDDGESGNVSIAPLPPAPIDSVLPRNGLDSGTAELRDRFGDNFADNNYGAGRELPKAGLLPDSGWLILPQIGVAEAWTDNAGLGLGNGSLGNVGSDFITEITPAVTVERQAERYTVNLNYAPVGLIYANNSSYSQVEEFASGDILGVAVPDWAYVDVRGSISQQSVYGNIGNFTTVAVAPNDRETNTSVSISPYISHQFGTAGTAQIGVSYTYSNTDAPGLQNSPLERELFGGFNPYGSSYLGTERVFASFTTGEDLGRFRDRIGVDASFYDGSQELRNAKRILVTDDASYSINRRFALIGQIGYEDLQYPVADFTYDGPIGAAGFTWTPHRDSDVTVEYRYIDGIGSPFVQASLQVAPRVRVFGGYSEGITTFQQDQQNQLLSGTPDTYGGPDSAALAAPLLTFSSAFGGNQQVNKLRRLDATAVWSDTRDVVTLSGQYEHTTPVGRSLYGTASSEGVFVSLGATRSLSPEWTVDGFVQYGSNRVALKNAQNANTITVSASLTRNFSKSLSAYIRFTGTYTLSGNTDGLYYGSYGNQNTITIGALKRFY
jgi:uncharacterized protein (PEP-CTERM system associated)